VTPAPHVRRPGSELAYYLGKPASRWLISTSTARVRAGRVVDPAVAYQRALGAGLIVHRAHPLNAETPLPAFTGEVVMSSDRFYVRNHFHIPDLNPATWRLRVSGLVERPLSLSLGQLRSMAAQTAVATLECAGNGRSTLDPSVPGEQWGLGAAGTATWTGVPLTDVVEQAAPRAGAREVIFRGADHGQVEGRDGPVPFERSVSLGHLASAGALLAYAMNDEPLPIQHGYPLRLIMPGWYGVASVKWLTEIELTSKAFDGHFQVDRYHIDGEPLTRQAVRSLITEPRAGETLEPGEVVVRGLAWSGAAPIDRVEVSIDNQPWQVAIVTGDQRSHGWQPWQLPARLERPGRIIMRARAVDLAGRTQPDQPHWNPLGYAANSTHQIQISVNLPAATTRAAGTEPAPLRRPARPSRLPSRLPGGQRGGRVVRRITRVLVAATPARRWSSRSNRSRPAAPARSRTGEPAWQTRRCRSSPGPFDGVGERPAPGGRSVTEVGCGRVHGVDLGRRGGMGRRQRAGRRAGDAGAP
jgi:DMSO/TMAO reductase YedYZ molybdopterin-dependent catalytic subunit